MLIGIAIKFAQRNRTQAEYAQLDRVGEMSMEPFVTNEELGQDALLGSSPSSSNQEINNQTESTLLPPPTEESNLEFENQGYKSQSSSGLSTDTDEFRSLNDTVTENPPAVTPEPATMPAATSTPRQEPENEESPTPTVELQTPTPTSTLPLRSKNIFRKRQRGKVSQSDPTRVQPKRAAKKKMDYKE